MTKPTGNNSEVRAEQAASTKVQTLQLGLDIHADSIVAVRILDHSAPQPAQKFTPAKFGAWVKTQLALAQEVHSCYEAGPFGYGLHRELISWASRTWWFNRSAWTSITRGSTMTRVTPKNWLCGW